MHRMHSLGGGSRVGLDVDTPLCGVEVESLEGTVSGEVLEDVDVLDGSALGVGLGLGEG